MGKISWIAALSTFFLLAFIGGLSLFFQMIALNGVSESRGTLAMGLSLAFQLVCGLGLSFLAGRLARRLTGRFRWNPVLAVAAAAFGASLVGGILSFGSLIASTLFAGIK